MPTHSQRSEGPPGDASDEPPGWEIDRDDRNWGILVHAAAFTGLVVPFGNILGPLLIWLIKKEDSEFVDKNGKASLNFQLSWTIWILLAAVTIFFMIGLILVPLLGLAWLILVVLGTIRASDGGVYEYPLTIRFIS